MTPQELKNSILQLAIQGKLVEQRREEGTAAELYKQIQAEKQVLIKAGKVKKEKPLPEITEVEVPFDIPESWIWVRLAQIATKITDGTHHSPPNTATGEYMYVTAKNIKPSGVYLNQITYVSKEIHEEIFSRCDPEKGDILLIKDGATTGVVTVNNLEQPFSMLSSVALIKLLPSLLHSDFAWYLVYVLRSDLFYKTIRAQMKGTGITRITLAQIEPLLIPLPPLAEQKRIVAKIEELLPLIDRYEQAWTRLEDFNKRFPGDMQKSLLQMAIQGKLVEQRPDEGTGEELFRQIQREKQALIKAGKIKKEKPLPEIAEDEIPFDIPESWKWVRLPSIASTCLGKMLDKQKNRGTNCPYLRNVNVRWGDFDLSDLLEMKFEDVNDDRFLISSGDLVMCEGGEPGRCAVWNNSFSIHFQKALHRIRFYPGVFPQFYQYYIKCCAESGSLNDLFTGTTIKHLTGQALDRIVVPLPPLAEQKRIIARLEELLPLCERLKRGVYED